ncbi:MAG: hypothetical protein GXO86_14425 [Chlorobi bacterium]|nr:hypothetical protein [Chlorobiota bacterium]
MLLVCNLNNQVFVCLDHIVREGTVVVKDEKQKIIHAHQFRNSNYEKVDMKEKKGNFTVKVNYESETVTKHIHI